jgi:tetratricopeptide (TPR) repeat protein
MKKTVFRNENYMIEFHRTTLKAKGLVHTFTPFMFANLDNSGYAVAFLLNSGFDVVAFKCNDNAWYQGLPPDALQSAARLSTGYAFVATYGSSMGGYAAIAFSRALGANLALALAPQYSIDEDFDTRWQDSARKIPQWTYRIDPGTAGGDALVVIYDDKNRLECAQIEKLKQAVSFKRISEVKATFSGHPPGQFLNQTGILKSVIAQALDGRTAIEISYSWSLLRRSEIYLKNLGNHAVDLGRLPLAGLCFSRLVGMAPENAGYQYRRGWIALRAGHTAEAVDPSERAVALAPGIALYRHHLGNVLQRVGRLDEAVAHCRQAVAILPGKAGYHHRLSLLANMAGHVEEAIEHGRRSVELAPEHPGFTRHLAALVKSHDRRRRFGARLRSYWTWILSR